MSLKVNSFILLAVFSLFCRGENNDELVQPTNPSARLQAKEDVLIVKEMCVEELSEAGIRAKQEIQGVASKSVMAARVAIKEQVDSAIKEIAALSQKEVSARAKEIKDEANSAYSNEMRLMQCISNWVGFIAIAVGIFGVVIPLFVKHDLQNELSDARKERDETKKEWASKIAQHGAEVEKIRTVKLAVEKTSAAVDKKAESIINIANMLETYKQELETSIADINKFISDEKGLIREKVDVLSHDTEKRTAAIKEYLMLVEQDMHKIKIERYISQACDELTLLRTTSDYSFFRKGLANICYAIHDLLTQNNKDLFISALKVFHGYCGQICALEEGLKQRCIESMDGFKWRFTFDQIKEVIAHMEVTEHEKGQLKCAKGAIEAFMSSYGTPCESTSTVSS